MEDDDELTAHQVGDNPAATAGSKIPVEDLGTRNPDQPKPGDANTHFDVRRSRRLRPGGRLWLLVGLVIALAATVAVVVVRNSPSRCASPITITEGGRYTGCWTSSQGSPAVTIATSEPVTVANSTMQGSQTLIENKAKNTKLTVTNCRLSGTYPKDSGAWGGYAVTLTGFDYILMEHNRIEHKGGIRLIDWTGVPSGHPVLVRYNLATDIDGRKSDGKGGYSGRTITTFLQLDGVRDAPRIEIAWNDVHNLPGNSAVEDNISMFASSGTSVSPIDIHDNYIDGAYPNDPANDTKYSGGGIMLGDGGGAWQIAHDNTVVSTTNYGIAISGGSNLLIKDNRVLSAGVLADGTEISAMNVGIYVWNQTRATANNNDAYDNTVGWWKAKTHARSDWWLPDCSGQCSNTHVNESAPIAEADRAAEQERWHGKLNSAGVTVGPM